MPSSLASYLYLAIYCARRRRRRTPAGRGVGEFLGRTGRPGTYSCPPGDESNGALGMVAAPSDARCTAEDGAPRRLLEGGMARAGFHEASVRDGGGAAGPARGTGRWAGPHPSAVRGWRSP
jgi:hypothetical protein